MNIQQQILVLILSVSLSFFSCTSSEISPTSNETYLVVDVTASAENKNHPLNLTTDKITRLFELDIKPMASVKYSQSIISEVHLNHVFSLKLEGVNSANFHKYKRKNKMRKFVKNVANAIKELENSEYDRASSSIFLALNTIINKVAKNDADKQLIICQSDMLDNSFLFSAYDKNQIKQLQKSPEFLSQFLEKQTPITMSLQKMKVIIVHQPNAQTDYVFRLIARQYKKYLQSKGATVEIVANV